MATRASGSADTGDGSGLTAAVLAHLPGLAPGESPAAVEALPGGVANRSLLVSTPAGRYVVRLHAPHGIVDAPARRRERLLHALAARAGLAPPIVWASDDGDVLITEYAPGRVWSAQDMQRAAQLQRLCEAWRALHALPPPAVEPFDAARTARRYRAAIVAADDADARGLDALVGEAVALAQSLAAEGRALTIVHGDPHSANVVDEGTRLRLIDWEYATLADPLVDPGCLLAYYPAAEPHAARVLEWSGLASVADPASLARACRLYEHLTRLWSRAAAAPVSGAGAHESAD